MLQVGYYRPTLTFCWGSEDLVRWLHSVWHNQVFGFRFHKTGST